MGMDAHEKKLEKQRRYREAHKEELLEKDRQRYLRNKEQAKQRYLENREQRLAYNREYGAKYRSQPDVRAKNKEYQQTLRRKRKESINNILLHYGCQNPDCHSRHVGYVVAELEFHHPNGRDSSSGQCVGGMVNSKLERLAEEINKCVVLCSNCHRRTHAGLWSPTKRMLCKVNKALEPLGEKNNSGA